MFKGEGFAVVEFGVKTLETYDTMLDGGHVAAGARRHREGEGEEEGERRRMRVNTKQRASRTN